MLTRSRMYAFAGLILPVMTACALALSVAPAGAAEDQPAPAKSDERSEWPCIARKVVEISPAQIWDGPSLEGTDNWRNDEDIRKLSEYVLARRIPVEDAEAAIKKYADGISEAERDTRLTLLFAAVLSRTNDERKIVISGIERFHKRQMARAKEIEAEGKALPKQGEALPTAPIEADTVDKLTPEEEKYKWEVKIFQERQQAMPIACEIPGLIEERAGAVARAIRANMKS